MFVAPSSVDLDAVEDLLSGFRVSKSPCHFSALHSAQYVKSMAGQVVQDPDEVSSDTVTEMERLPAESTPQDRLRLFLILYLRCSVDDQALHVTFHLIFHPSPRPILACVAVQRPVTPTR